MNHLSLEIAKHEMTRRLAEAERRSRQRATAPQRRWVRRTAPHR